MKLGKKNVGFNTLIVSRWCICNAKCHCRNAPGFTANYNTIELLGDYSTA